MHVSIGDTILLMVPTVALLVVGMLGLDEHLFSPTSAKKRGRFKPRFANFEQGDEMVLADPDGRISRRGRK